MYSLRHIWSVFLPHAIVVIRSFPRFLRFLEKNQFVKFFWFSARGCCKTKFQSWYKWFFFLFWGFQTKGDQNGLEMMFSKFYEKTDIQDFFDFFLYDMFLSFSMKLHQGKIASNNCCCFSKKIIKIDYST